MTNMSQFSDEMDEISFVESSSIYDETDISINVSICENEGPGTSFVKLAYLVAGTLSKTQC